MESGKKTEKKGSYFKEKQKQFFSHLQWMKIFIIDTQRNIKSIAVYWVQFITFATLVPLISTLAEHLNAYLSDISFMQTKKNEFVLKETFMILVYKTAKIIHML